MCYGLMYAGNLIGTALTFGIGMVKGTGVDNPLVSTVMQLNVRKLAADSSCWRNAGSTAASVKT